MGKLLNIFLKPWNHFREKGSFLNFSEGGEADALNREKSFLETVEKKLLHLCKMIELALTNFLGKRMQVRAPALAYYSVFAMIPILAFVIGIARGFGFDIYVVRLLEEQFQTHSEYVGTILGYVERYLRNANGGAFVGVGIVMLLWSVLRVFSQVEFSFNEIWGVKKNRPWVRRFTDYIAIVLLVPGLILVSSGISFYFNFAINYFDDTFLVTPSLRFLLDVMPYVTTFVVFTLLYWIIPNTKVKFKNAAIAGVLAGLSFMIFKWGYIYVQTWMTTYNAVYGSLAAIPFLLIFLQGTWIIILVGAEIAFATQCLKENEHKQDVRNISIRYNFYAALLITNIIAKRAMRNEPALTIEEIVKGYGIPYQLANVILDRLCGAEIVMMAHYMNKKKEPEHVYRLAVDSSRLTVAKFFNMYDKQGSDDEDFKLSEREGFQDVWNFTGKVKTQLLKQNYNILVRDL